MLFRRGKDKFETAAEKMARMRRVSVCKCGAEIIDYRDDLARYDRLKCDKCALEDQQESWRIYASKKRDNPKTPWRIGRKTNHKGGKDL